MKSPQLHVLIIEDDAADAELIERQLERLAHACECRCVDTSVALEQALTEKVWDMVICDHVLPDMDSYVVLASLHQLDPKPPMILVSGAIGEEEVASVMRAGARHFINKNNLERLPQVAALCLMEAKADIRQMHDDRVREQLSRLEAIKNLAGGVAHDFNNVLAAIGSAAFMIRVHAEGNEKLHASVNIIERSVEKGAATARKLLEFARGGKFESSAVNLATLIEQMIQSDMLDVPSNIQLQTHFEAAIPDIKGDAMQLKNMLAGIVCNGFEAMSAGGTLEICLDSHAVNKQEADDYPGLHAGDYVRLRIADHGYGMDESLLAHVFEPFFTTKFQGRGLGLAAAYGIMKGHQGFIYIDSKPGVGTTVMLFFPVAGE